MTSPNLSHYYISKKPLLVSQSFGRLVLAVWSWADWQNFERLVMVFLKYKNGSNLERSLLSTIKSYGANGSKLKIFYITLGLAGLPLLMYKCYKLYTWHFWKTIVMEDYFHALTTLFLSTSLINFTSKKPVIKTLPV